MDDLGREPGDPAERFNFDPDPEEFYREVEAARFRAEQQRPPEGAASRDEIYRGAIVFVAILIVVIVLAIWFSVTSL